jgi:hypothetical protein
LSHVERAKPVSGSRQYTLTASFLCVHSTAACCAGVIPGTVAGGPFDEELYKCKLQPVEAALARGLYGSWTPSESELARLHEIFPTGVCDYTKRDEGRPPGFH